MSTIDTLFRERKAHVSSSRYADAHRFAHKQVARPQRNSWN